MAIVNQAAYDRLKAQWATDAQIKAQIVKQYWNQWWADFDTFLSWKTTNTPTTTPTTTPTATPATTPTVTPTVTKTTVTPVAWINIDNLKKLEATWVKPTTIISNIVKQYWKDSSQWTLCLGW